MAKIARIARILKIIFLFTQFTTNLPFPTDALTLWADKIFEDLKKESGCKTIIELLDYFKANVGYAFIIFTPDDYGCLCEEMDKLTTRLLRDKKKSRIEARATTFWVT